jgi:hypothetical protein
MTYRSRLLAGACLVFALAGCGAVAPRAQLAASGRSGGEPGTGRPLAAPVSVCGQVSALTGLEVRRIVPSSVTGLRFTFPAVGRVTSRPAVRQLAQVLCELPALPRGRFCTLDLGVRYLLTFSGPAPTRAVFVSPGGCEPATGTGTTARTLLAHAGFWSAFGAAMGISQPGLAAFFGTVPSGMAGVLEHEATDPPHVRDGPWH